ncbi:hypothetical protein OSB04_021036 [Centaurea solstitialis]|uniref:Retrovirus-related Pol polyprotein from transposon TNT 1-94-like beta-barrel domain-containing protein n=1 Tax=Centaurea solstitialis TaxID=347529 RepID=A0AA38T159_9ASTR|nr:hypothetical protein OSB04_021036 [Centaurea solstitialis]
MSAARGWFLDSLTENHVTNSRSDFVNYQNIEGKGKLLNRRRMKVVGIGTVKLKCSNGKTLTLEKVLHVPKMSKKIVSAGELTENGCVIILHSQAVIHGQGSIFYGEKIDRLYRLDLDHVIDISDDESSGDSDDKMIRSTKDMLKSKFDMKGMGLSYITRTQNCLVLSQTHYVDKILEKFYKGDTSITKTPSDTSQHLSKNKRG